LLFSCRWDRDAGGHQNEPNVSARHSASPFQSAGRLDTAGSDVRWQTVLRRHSHGRGCADPVHGGRKLATVAAVPVFFGRVPGEFLSWLELLRFLNLIRCRMRDVLILFVQTFPMFENGSRDNLLTTERQVRKYGHAAP